MLLFVCVCWGSVGECGGFVWVQSILCRALIDPIGHHETLTFARGGTTVKDAVLVQC